MNLDEAADIPTIGHKHLEEFSPAFPSNRGRSMPGQFHQSALWAVHIRVDSSAVRRACS
ncbi:hypothetical protein [Pseudomonas sp. KCJK8993]|uniref:hypothetical protein n=1 Tax=Pseudomonas sp. KCJK8993 TaxID=3344565 RepID=UPI0039066143